MFLLSGCHTMLKMLWSKCFSPVSCELHHEKYAFFPFMSGTKELVNLIGELGHSSHAWDILVLLITNRTGCSLCICRSSHSYLWSCGACSAQPGSYCAMPWALHSLFSWSRVQRSLSYSLRMELAEQYENLRLRFTIGPASQRKGKWHVTPIVIRHWDGHSRGKRKNGSIEKYHVYTDCLLKSKLCLHCDPKLITEETQEHQ